MHAALLHVGFGSEIIRDERVSHRTLSDPLLMNAGAMAGNDITEVLGGGFYGENCRVLW